MNSTSPLALLRRWSLGALLAAAVGVGVVGVHLADHSQGTTAAAATTGSRGSSSSSAGSQSSSSFSAVPAVGPAAGSSQSKSSAS